MMYFEHLSEEDRVFINQNFHLPSELTLAFVYRIQDDKKFMKIIEYCYRLYEADELIDL